MAHSIVTFLMFEGAAEEALRLYMSLFSDSEIKRLEHYGPGEPGPAGKVKRADVLLNGQLLMFFDSPVHHAFAFTPSISLFVECVDEAEQERVYNRLLDGGEALMPLNNYGFSTRFGWLKDRFGVSWQLNLR